VIGTDKNARLEKLLQGPIKRRSTITGPNPVAENQNSNPSRGNIRKSISNTGLSPAIKRKSIKALRSIRDDENRLIRKTSIAPDQAFICEETILEDLCELSGLEARTVGGKVNGGIILKEQKMDLLRRLSRNPETAPVLSSANNFRRFSQNAMTSTGIRSVEESVDSFDQPSRRKTEIGQVPPEIGPRSSVTGGPRRSQLGSGPRQSLRSKDNLFMKGSSMEIVASIESNGKSLHRARKQSVKRQSVTVGDKAHYVSTHCNYRTEIAALKMATAKESCSCIRNLLAKINIFI